MNSYDQTTTQYYEYETHEYDLLFFGRIVRICRGICWGIFGGLFLKILDMFKYSLRGFFEVCYGISRGVCFRILLYRMIFRRLFLFNIVPRTLTRRNLDKPGVRK